MISRALLAAALLPMVAATAIAQVADGDASSTYVPAGSTGVQFNHFGTCILVRNPTATDAQYEFATSPEWATFVANPNPGVTHSACPPPPPAACDDSAGAHASGSEWTINSTGSESCAAAGFGAGSTGTATDTVSTTFICTNGVISEVGQSSGAFNTSGCLNAEGGSCTPIDINACNALNQPNNGPIGPEPTCIWGIAQPGPGNTIGTSTQTCWHTNEFRSHVFWQPSADGCSCNGTPVADGAISPTIANLDCSFNRNPPVPPDLSGPACVGSLTGPTPPGCVAPSANGNSVVDPQQDFSICPGPSGP